MQIWFNNSFKKIESDRGREFIKVFVKFSRNSKKHILTHNSLIKNLQCVKDLLKRYVIFEKKQMFEKESISSITEFPSISEKYNETMHPSIKLT